MKFDLADVQVTGIWKGKSSWCPSLTIKVTHMPTGVSVESKEDRSQYKMRAQAISSLREKIEGMLI